MSVINDNSYVKKELLADAREIISIVADKTLEQLEKEGVFVFPEMHEAEDLSKNQMILQSVNDSFFSGNVMGFLGIGNERLTIKSRFSTDKNDFFFQYLLEKVLNIPNIVNMDTDTNQEERIFHLLLFLFPSYLKAALRKGIYKSYVRNEYNDGNPKGTIDIPRHIKKNIPFLGKLAYTQREYSYDNEVMELIRHTIEYIKKKPYGKKLLDKVKDEVKLVVEATTAYRPCDLRKILVLNKKNVIRHAYFREYCLLQQLCMLILQNQKHQIGTGSRKIFGILFDGAWLWEEYINMLIGENGECSKCFYHPKNKARQGAQYLFAGNIGKIYPDFISKDSENRVIADAKYKPMDNIRQSDYLQVLAYMFRFEAKKGFYFYPEVNEVKPSYLWMNKGTTYEKNLESGNEICLLKYGLRIPITSESYSEFVVRMKQSEEEFIAGYLRECGLQKHTEQIVNEREETPW